MIKVVVMVGGISRDSINRKLFSFLEAMNGGRFAFDVPNPAELPFFSQDLEDAPPASVVAFKKRFADAQAVLFVTPEYNRSIPGVLKNAVDWTSRPVNLGRAKPAAILGAAAGPIGTFGAQQHLRQVLGVLDYRTMCQPEFYLPWPQYVNAAGTLAPASAERLAGFLDAFEAWIKAHGGATS